MLWYQKDMPWIDHVNGVLLISDRPTLVSLLTSIFLETNTMCDNVASLKKTGKSMPYVALANFKQTYHITDLLQVHDGQSSIVLVL